MAIAGISYKPEVCEITAQLACNASNYIWSSNTCYKSSLTALPEPCIIPGSVSPVINVPALDILVNAEYAQYIVYAGLWAFAVGFGIGLILRMIRKVG